MKIEGKVKAVSKIRDVKSKKQVGFILESNSSFWYNVSGSEEELNKLKKSILQKGNTIGFEYDKLDRTIKGLVLREKSKEKAEKESSDWEDDIVNFETLLTAAHNKKNPFSIHTNMLAVDLEKKYALFKATVTVGKEGTVEIFEAHGDATEENVKGDFIKPHFIRMAETRAICRALRWYTNNGCAEEEKK